MHGLACQRLQPFLDHVNLIQRKRLVWDVWTEGGNMAINSTAFG